MTQYARCLFARLIHAPEISFCLCKCIILTLSPSFSPPAEPLSLMDLCRRSVRVALGRERLSEIHRLPLPASLKNYLLYQWRRRQSQHSEHTLISLFLWDHSRVKPVWQHCSSLQDWISLMILWVRFHVSGWTPFQFLILFLMTLSQLYYLTLSNQESLSTMHTLIQAMPWQSPVCRLLWSR